MNLKACELLQITDMNAYKFYENEYKKQFESYILSVIDLKKYDDMIKNSELGFGPLANTVDLKSQLYEFLDLNHIYILNDFYIEKLSVEDFNILKSDSDIEKFNMIKRTYKEVIICDYINNKKIENTFKINYTDSSSISDMSDNDQLVIGIYYGKNPINYNNMDKYLSNREEKIQYLNNVADMLKDEFNSKLNLSIKVLFKLV